MLRGSGMAAGVADQIHVHARQPGGSFPALFHRRGEQGKMEKTGCKIICGALTTLAVKGLMMMMMMIDDDD